MQSLLSDLKRHGIETTGHLQNLIGIIPCSDNGRLRYLFQVADHAKPEIVNTHGFRIYGNSFLSCIIHHVKEMDLHISDDFERQRRRDEREKALFDLFF